MPPGHACGLQAYKRSCCPYPHVFSRPTVTKLLINIDHVATLRNARRETFPDPVRAAMCCELAGADGVVFHLRADRRHITDADVVRLKKAVYGKLDFELSTDPEIVAICCKTRPHLATLVPEKREEVTTEGGLDVRANTARLKEVIPQLQGAGIQVALFVDPDLDQIEAAHALGVEAIELHTGDYANARNQPVRQLALARQHARAAAAAHALGLHVHAGHGLDYNNYPLFREVVPHLAEVSIGFAVIARSVFIGLDQAVRDLCRLVK